MRIRPIEREEWQALREVRLRALAESPDAFGETYAEAAALPDDDWRQRAGPSWSDGSHQRCVVVDDGHTFLGMTVGVLETPDTVHVYAMWVAPEHRGRGLGRELVDAITAWARELGARRLLLGVTETNGGAAAMYHACGFVPAGEDTYHLRAGSPLRCSRLVKELVADG